MGKVNAPPPNITLPTNTFEQRQADAAKVAGQNKALEFAGRLGGAAIAGVTGGNPFGALGGLGGAGGVGELADLQSLLREQTKVQARMQEFSMQSNISKSDHDSKMTAIRNMRAG